MILDFRRRKQVVQQWRRQVLSKVVGAGVETVGYGSAQRQEQVQVHNIPVHKSIDNMMQSGTALGEEGIQEQDKAHCS